MQLPYRQAKGYLQQNIDLLDHFGTKFPQTRVVHGLQSSHDLVQTAWRRSSAYCLRDILSVHILWEQKSPTCCSRVFQKDATNPVL